MWCFENFFNISFHMKDIEKQYYIKNYHTKIQNMTIF